MNDTLQKLKAIAEAATSGPWEIDAGNTICTVNPLPTPKDGPMSHEIVDFPLGERKNSKFVATMNPSTVLALLELVEYWKDIASGYVLESQAPSILEQHYDDGQQEILQRIKEGAGL